MTQTSRRAVHGVVAVVTIAAVLWQLVLIVNGEGVLDETAVKPLGTRLVEFISYFTVLSNLLVAYVSVTLARDPDHDGSFWRVVRLATIEGITVTGLVHWFFLRPILDLHGASYVVDKLLHAVVPILALVAWAVAGPRGQAVRAAVLPSLGWPLLWGAYTLVRGVLADWWPYPFMNVDRLGWGRVLVNLAAIAVLFAVVGLGFVAADRGLERRHERRQGRTDG